MATLREYFDTDLNRCMSVFADWQLQGAAGTSLPPIRARISQDFDANAKYWSFFLPDGVDVAAYASAVFRAEETAKCVLSREGDSVYVESGFVDYPDRATSETLLFTRRIWLYIDAFISSELRSQILEHARQAGFHVLIRDRDYATKRSALEKPLAFICHDSRDKDAIVRELAHEMARLLCHVWYDEFSLAVGDSLRVSIEKGLKESRKCIVILSPNFCSNSGWSKAEFDAIFTREILEKKNVLLPVWHNVGVREVYEYCPRLADRIGLGSELGVKELAQRLTAAVKAEA